MKIDVNGIEELRSRIQTPFESLAQQLSQKNCLDKNTSEIVSFIFEQFSQLGEEPWEIID